MKGMVKCVESVNEVYGDICAYAVNVNERHGDNKIR